MASERFDPAWNWLPKVALLYALPLGLLSVVFYQGVDWSSRDFWTPLLWGWLVPWLNTRARAGRPWAFRDFLNRDSYPPLIAPLHASVWWLALTATRDAFAAAACFFLFFMAYDALLLRWGALSVYAVGESTQRSGALAVLASFGFAWWGYLSLGLAAVHLAGADGLPGIAASTALLIAPVQAALLWLRLRRDAPQSFTAIRRVAVVGAGWSGLYAAKWLKEYGLEVSWLEAGDDVGGVWKFRRDAAGGVTRNTRATSSKHFLHASDFPMPRSLPDFPEHAEILGYLRSYADHFGLRGSLRTGRRVTRIEKDGAGWRLFSQDRDGEVETEMFDAVAVCAGPHQRPRLDPRTHPLYNRFEGPIHHAADCKDAAEIGASETVLVVGAGESAADLVAELAQRGVKVQWASRRSQWFADRNIGPHAADHFTAVGLRVLLGRLFYVEHLVRHFIIAPFIDLAWGRGGHGIRRWSPQAPYLHQFLNKSRDAVREVHRGRVATAGAPRSIEGRRVRFEGSAEEVEVDRLILATGYKPDWPFLEKQPIRLFKKVFDLADPTLAFVGHVRPVLGSIPSLAELQARWIGHVWSGRGALPCPRRRASIDFLDRVLQRRSMLDSSELGILVDQESYAGELASFVDARVPWLMLLLTRPRGFLAVARSPWTAFKHQLNSPDPKKRKAALRHILQEMPESKKPGRGGHPVFLLTRFLTAASLVVLASLAVSLWLFPAWLVTAALGVVLLAGGVALRLAAPAPSIVGETQTAARPPDLAPAEDPGMRSLSPSTIRHAVRYFSIYLFAPVMFLGFVRGGVWAFVIPTVGFLLIPLLELLTAPRPAPPPPPNPLGDRLFDWALYVALPVQYFLLWSFLDRLASDPPSTGSWLGMVWTMGIACGVFGINVGHELGHRHRWPEQLSSRLLFMTALYTHMVPHHNRAHHAWVGTPRDPNTALPGESLYAFWLRSITRSYWSAWNVQARRLGRRGLSLWSPRNELLWWQPIQWGLLAGVFFHFGAASGLSFVAAAAVGVLMLETINYIEHYGLLRKRLPSGRFEKMGRRHAWNSDHAVGRTLLFQVTRHSDHHLHPAKEYQHLLNLDRSPQMPTGYPGTMLLATVPPLWRRVIGPRLEEARRSPAGD